jgi:hypothetical protein
MGTHTRDGSPIRILNVVDEYTRVALGCRVARSIGARDVIAELEELFDKHGRPDLLRSDNGREFIAETLTGWLAEQGVKTAFIEKGSPQQNAFVERFNGTMRDELLNGEEFDNLLEARVVIGNWLLEYNTLRPHRGLGMLTTPAAYTASIKEGTSMRATALTEAGPVEETRGDATATPTDRSRPEEDPRTTWTKTRGPVNTRFSRSHHAAVNPLPVAAVEARLSRRMGDFQMRPSDHLLTRPLGRC